MLSEYEKEAIIISRYGGLAVGPTICTIPEIAKSFNVPLSTVERVLRLFTEHDGRIITDKRGRKSPEIPENIRNALLDPATLQRWGHLSIRDRIRRCKLEFDYDISYHNIRKLY